MITIIRSCKMIRSIPSKNITYFSKDISKYIYFTNWKNHLPARNNTHIRFISTTKSSDEKDSITIYNGALKSQIFAVKIFSLTTSLTGLVAQPIIFSQASNLGTPMLVGIIGFVGFFTFVTPLLLHLITKNYVTEMFYNSNQNQYSAITYNFFLMKKLTHFTPDDVKIPQVPGIFTTFLAKGRPLFIDTREFSESLHYGKIMGYDKPIDFRFYENDEENIKEKPSEKTAK